MAATDFGRSIEAFPSLATSRGGPGQQAPFESVISIQSSNLAKTLDQVYRQEIYYTSKIQRERLLVEDLTTRIKRVAGELEERRKKLGPTGARGRGGGEDMYARDISKVENRLQQCLTKNSVVEASKAKLKAEVDSLRRERLAELNAKRRLELELQRSKLDCTEKMRLTQQMHDAKERTRREIDMLKNDIIRDIDSFQNEFDCMVAQLSNGLSGSQASQAKLEALIRNKDLMEKPEGLGDDDVTKVALNGKENFPKHRAQRLRQQNSMAYWMILKKKNDLQSKAARTGQLGQVLEKITEATGLQSLEDFVPVMLEAEEENYSLFRLINELNKELEELELEKTRVNTEIESLSHINRRTDQQRMKAGLQEQIQRTKSTAEMYDAQYQKDLQLIKGVEESITSIFGKMSHEDEAVQRQLTAMGVTERNILLFLGLIEQQIEHIVQVHNAATENSLLTNNNAHQPNAPKLDESGARIPSLKTPSPPSGDMLESVAEDKDDSSKPIHVAKVLASMKETMSRLQAEAAATRANGLPVNAGGAGVANSSSSATNLSMAYPTSSSVGSSSNKLSEPSKLGLRP